MIALDSEPLKLMCSSLLEEVEKKDFKSAKMLAFAIYRLVQAWADHHDETNQLHDADLTHSNTSDTYDQ